MKGLYLITDGNPDRLLERVEAALKGGVETLQYRDKNVPDALKVETATALRKLCHRYQACFIVNDTPELALATEADGVHLGQQDMHITEARRLLGPGKIIGISTRTIDQAQKAEAEGADYIAVGSMFPTGSKPDAELVGPERLRQMRKGISKPIVAIGGINRANIHDVIDAGADAVAMISSIMQDSNPALATRELSLAFNRGKQNLSGKVLTIAGSDSGGGAGIQADLKTITLLGGYGMSAITALTAQNSLGVRGIHPCPADFVAKQIDAVLEDFGADVIKTGMLFSAEIIRRVARALGEESIPAVVDPVMIAKGGATLLKEDAIEALRETLLPTTYLITPNLPEAEALVGFPIVNRPDMEKAALLLHEMGARHVLIKGGHLAHSADDLLYCDNTYTAFPSERIDTEHTHGTGCTYSAAIATFLAQGHQLVKAVEMAKRFIHEAIRTAPGLGKGHGPVNHLTASKLL